MHRLFFPVFALGFGVLAHAQNPSSELPAVEGHLRREPVLPINLPDYELVTVDVQKEIVFHVGNQTLIGRVPIMAYVPVARAGRARATDRLIEARAILVKAAASTQVTTADLAAIRDLIELATVDLRSDAAPLVRAVVEKK
jgi:hypothetical protein